ncbi:hypothetical protein NRF20_42330 [Streptomyces sp. R-74717]|uniref:hypothetical protein n=1 Tax=Streptomyces sp. R-74717 TaxID=2969820 RepID=UPI0039B6E93D
MPATLLRSADSTSSVTRAAPVSAEVLARLPQHQMKIIRHFAEWNIIRAARRRSTRGRYTVGAATGDRKDIRAAIDFLNWLDENQLDLAAAGQEDLDLWLTTHPTLQRSIGAFIRWTGARRLTNKMGITAERTGLPSRFITETALNEQLKRCLNDDELPLDVRIAGGPIGLYALLVVRLVELTTDRFERTRDDAYLTIERNPVLLPPPKLALLIEEQVARPTVCSMVRPPQDGRPTYLLPGSPAHRPITAQRIVNKLRGHGLQVISARNTTAMLEAVADLPPIVISDLFGVSATSAHRWARFAQDSWADYLTACTDDDAGPSEES